VRDLRHAGVLDAELLAKQGTLLMEPVVLRCVSHPRINAIGSPGARVYDGVVGECDCMEYRQFYAVLPDLGTMDLGRLRFGEHRGLRKRVLESSQLKDTIRAIDSASYGPHGEPKDWVDQGTRFT
jgi:hypothetical protein